MLPLNQIALSFVEGLALIASPCILPVLPLVLSASVEGGRRRPFGIITGFVIAFSLFVFVSRKLVSFFHIDPDAIKYGSLALLTLFGLVLLSSKLSEKFSALTQSAADVGSRVGADSSGGYFSGVVIGSLIGLIWTPCAGPVLAAVLVQVIRETSDSAAYLMIFAFSLGAGVPMLAIALAGRKLLGKLGFITNHTEAFRKIVGVIILFSVAFIASGIDVQTLFTPKSAGPAGAALALEDPLEKPYPAPDFATGTWINSRPLEMKDLKGKVVLVDFWTYSCINCIRTLPYVTDWYAKYRDKGLVIVGVHSPEFAFEKDVANVKAAVKQRGIEYPVVMDNNLNTWTNFANKFWPAHYLIDRDGKVVSIHYGEGNYDRTENNIRYLLGLKDKAAATPEASESRGDQSPETYLGTARRERFDADASALPVNHWALTGKWSEEPERIIAEEAGATIQFHFHAKKVFLVMGTNTGHAIPVSLSLNSQPTGTLSVDKNTLYDLVKLSDFREGTITITAGAPGLEAYAFTFGE